MSMLRHARGEAIAWLLPFLRWRWRVADLPEWRRSMATKLILSYLLIIVVAVIIIVLVGTQLVGQLILSEAQTSMANALNTAREILYDRLDDVYDVVRLTSDRFFLKDALQKGKIEEATAELARIARSEGLDFLTVADASGKVILRTSNPSVIGDYRNHDPLIAAARERKIPVAAVNVMARADLLQESPLLADQAYIRFVETPKARPRPETKETSGMVLEAVSPILGYHNGLIGFLYGGVLLNRNYEIVDKVKETVFQGLRYGDKDVGTATIFLDDVRIATNVLNADGTRAVGTRVAADVYRRVVNEGKRWTGRAFVVNNWYIAAYEPIRNLNGQIIGILYVGVLEKKYVAIRQRTLSAFLAIVLLGGLFSMALSYYIARRVSAGLARLTQAARKMAEGKLDVRVPVQSDDELGDLADAFNTMADALQQREAQLREYAHSRIRESERLAIIGQLAAGVAHELNNPLQGILAYAYMLLEKVPSDSPLRPFLEKIAVQADRSREIIRGLLDFARPRPPHVRPTNVNSILQECLALVEKQAMFHNIRIIKNLQPDLPTTMVDPSQMQQVFMNIIVNAAEAMDGAGTLIVNTRFDPARSMIEIAMSDTGRGIPPEDLERVFDPFFSNKQTGKGTGLGLAISQSIVKEHRGTIRVQSEVGKGTTFTVSLPVEPGGDG
ncbi:MAG: cache domain-containing protein [Armatimonadota bacterium]|nr:cache domain-containing protein [Armatimonadota bacterium]MDR5702332.1 cache domain-containing protein [Armatimonadota bacterium]